MIHTFCFISPEHGIKLFSSQYIFNKKKKERKICINWFLLIFLTHIFFMAHFIAKIKFFLSFSSFFYIIIIWWVIHIQDTFFVNLQVSLSIEKKIYIIYTPGLEDGWLKHRWIETKRYIKEDRLFQLSIYVTFDKSIKCPMTDIT